MRKEVAAFESIALCLLEKEKAERMYLSDANSLKELSELIVKMTGDISASNSKNMGDEEELSKSLVGRIRCINFDFLVIIVYSTHFKYQNVFHLLMSPVTFFFSGSSRNEKNKTSTGFKMHVPSTAFRKWRLLHQGSGIAGRLLQHEQVRK